jgi:hypothetical protein
MGKITSWATRNKLKYNEEKTKTMLISRRKRREEKEIHVYLNHKLVEQEDKILRNNRR